jgi:hypothetical protein
MNKISELAKLFAKYKVYPKSCYDDSSPVRAFQRIFPGNHYSKDLETFFSYQDYKPTQRGADLSWWGKHFFSGKKSFRTMVISQDSGMEDAKSIVLAAQFFPDMDPNKYQEFIDEMGVNKYFGFNRCSKVRNQLAEWGIDFNLLYITDASKVYKDGSWKDWDFDIEKSKELLGAEIEFCKPDLIILLGGQPLHLLDKTKKYASVIESGKPLSIKGRKCVVSPFLIGNGPTQPNFKRRLEIASNLIKKAIK